MARADDRPPRATGEASSPLLAPKDHGTASVFTAENLLREGRRQRGLPEVTVPEVCVLDPDGDIVRHLTAAGVATPHPGWACYHTTLFTFDLDGREVGVVGCAVGAPFAVLVAEPLATSGCGLVVSITSAGQVGSAVPVPSFVVIGRALRDEGTSLHYRPAGRWSDAPGDVVARLDGAFDDLDLAVVVESSWTTDAPYRETASAIAAAEELGAGVVEMEAAALYAYATARGREVVCVAHVTNAMAVDGDDFEKGEADGAHDALAVARVIIGRLRPRQDGQGRAGEHGRAPSLPQGRG